MHAANKLLSLAETLFKAPTSPSSEAGKAALSGEWRSENWLFEILATILKFSKKATLMRSGTRLGKSIEPLIANLRKAMAFAKRVEQIRSSISESSAQQSLEQ